MQHLHPGGNLIVQHSLQELIAPLLDKSVNLINGEKFSTLSDGEG
jgi:hypothetical protein